MFIPPEGAMQFELIPNGFYGAKDAALDWKDKEDDCIWVVKSPMPNSRSCQCCTVYDVVLNSLPPRMRTLARMKMKEYKSRRIHVCSCMGRIIE